MTQPKTSRIPSRVCSKTGNKTIENSCKKSNLLKEIWKPNLNKMELLRKLDHSLKRSITLSKTLNNQ